MALLVRLADFGDHGCRLHGRARWRIELLVVVELDDFDVRHVLRRLLAHDHHEHGANGEIRRNECRRVIRLGKLCDVCFLRVRQARRADDRRHMRCERGLDVFKHDIGPREINHDVRVHALECRLEVCLDRDARFRQADELPGIGTALEVSGSDELEFRVFLHGFEHGLSHAAAGSIYEYSCQCIRLQAKYALIVSHVHHSCQDVRVQNIYDIDQTSVMCSNCSL